MRKMGWREKWRTALDVVAAHRVLVATITCISAAVIRQPEPAKISPRRAAAGANDGERRASEADGHVQAWDDDAEEREEQRRGRDARV